MHFPRDKLGRFKTRPYIPSQKMQNALKMYAKGYLVKVICFQMDVSQPAFWRARRALKIPIKFAKRVTP